WAASAITGAGVVVGAALSLHDAPPSAGNVISETPTAGTLVNVGSAVDLLVSKGPAQVAVPDVVGATQAAATTAITGAGLVVGAVTLAQHADVQSGKVIGGRPPPGTIVN